METDLSFKEMRKAWHGNLRAYVIGFTTSLILTSISFSLVIFEILPVRSLMITISILALIQGTMQLRYFLHLGEEPKPRWETFTFFFMFLVLLIIAIGSLWIMFDLDERMMTHHIAESINHG